MTKRSLLAYENWNRAQEKFDYFILGVIGALCAYLTQNLNPSALGLNPATAELLAVVFLMSSAIIGFLRVETGITIFSINHKQLSLSEKKGGLVSNFQGAPLLNEETGQVFTAQQIVNELEVIDKAAPLLKSEIERLCEKSVFLYKLRNYFLLIGFSLLVLSKLWAAYQLT